MLQHLLFLRPQIEGVSVTTENLIFKLVYAVSCPLFLAFGVIFYTRVCFTDPINCVANSSESFKLLKAIDSYCLENSYVIPAYDFAPNPGGQHSSVIDIKEDARLYLSNYQYVGIFFVICGAICYLPYVLWEWFENGLLKSLLEDLMSITLVDFNELSKKVKKLANVWNNNREALNTYAAANVLCEAANTLCLLLLFHLCNEFLQGHFLTLGLTSAQVFPKSAFCAWDTLGLSGAVHYEALCSMNMNYLSEKMFYAAWWWLLLCTTLSLVNLTYRYCLVKNVEFRVWTIKAGHLHSIGSLVEIKNQQPEDTKMNAYLEQISYGELFMLKRIQANVPPNTFRKILEEFNTSFRVDKKEE